jgi:glyoxylate reductase
MLLGHDVYGKTLGIIGFGRIGQSVARRARGFDMRIQYYDPQPPPESVGQALDASPATLDAILRTSDFISVHVPLLPHTHHLIDDAALASMKPNAILINTSRGPVIHEKALVHALKSGRIAAAGLDVFENEPQIEPELLELNNVVLAPHIASASHETRLRMCMLAVENLVGALRGDRPPSLVNPEVWERRRPSTFVPFPS